MCTISSDFFRGTSDPRVISALTRLLNFTREAPVPSADSGWSHLAIGLGLRGLPGWDTEQGQAAAHHRLNGKAIELVLRGALFYFQLCSGEGI